MLHQEQKCSPFSCYIFHVRQSKQIHGAISRGSRNWVRGRPLENETSMAAFSGDLFVTYSTGLEIHGPLVAFSGHLILPILQDDGDMAPYHPTLLPPDQLLDIGML